MSFADRKSVWELLRSGAEEQALVLLQNAYAQKPNAGNIIRLGIGYLWTRNYLTAWEHFHHPINTYRSPADIFHGMAGIAKWCINEPAAAVDAWRAGFGAPYTVGASVVRLPLLLFAASILRPDVFSKKEAEHILKERIENPLIDNWPGPLVKFILNLIDEDFLKSLWIGNVGNRKRGVMPHRRWLTEFYKTLLELDLRDLSDWTFQRRMREITSIARSEWSEDRHFALLLQCEEFFLARHEVSLAERSFLNKN